MTPSDSLNCKTTRRRVLVSLGAGIVALTLPQGTHAQTPGTVLKFGLSTFPPTIKPFDAETVLAQVNTDRLVVTCENHTVIGGLFETVASAVVTRGIAKQITPVALPDEFLAAGALPTLHDRYGISTDAMARSIRGWMTADG